MKLVLKYTLWLFIAVVAIAITVAIFLISVFTLTICENYSMKPTYYKQQLQRLDSLKKVYADVNYEGVNENLFTDFNTNDTALMVNTNLHSLRVLGTHNSYKQGLNPYASFLFNYCIPFTGNYNYSFEDLTTQLNNGVRSFEIDVNISEVDGKRIYEAIHHPLLDNRSSMIDFQLGLREIAMWSKNNPKHMPITVLLEMKPINLIADTKEATVDDLMAWSDMMRKEFDDAYYSSQDMLCGYDDYLKYTEDDAYPSLESMKGKVIFLLHDGDLAKKYIAEVDLKDMGIFPMISGTSMIANVELRKATPFSMSNYPLAKELMSKLTDEYNLIVRTRLDDYPIVKTEDFDAALSGNAHILSTDWPPTTQRGHYIAYLKGDKTIILRTSTLVPIRQESLMD